ncbi:SMI1/KNR4 family protein [Erwinia billingiae]|uniref:SMI1/KNR4 family protein n=1 Tax=Erwinia billingiae TaxID=182337 RepID=UPI0022463E7D|nr:SMI1/KNR4 family protein [Erwinia billingiae]MCX0498899.1 SMI1/KNR4 family protein [Erwinia billingiae]
MSQFDLKTILIPPHLPSENGDKEVWPLIDNIFSFPDDYVDFTKSYGTGRIADFIALFNPFTKNDDLNFFEQKKLILEDFNYLIEEDANYYKYTLYPNKKGLLPVGVTDNGDYFFWVVSSTEDSNLWGTAIVASRSPDVEYFDESITSLLAGILSKKIKPDSLPGNFPYKQITFDQM